MAGTQLVNWLNDAYAMELGLVPILENHARDASADPAARARIEQHGAETRRHADLLQGCIAKLGGQPSSIRAAVSSVIGGIESLVTAPFSDELVKNVLMDFATEQFEIGCYRALWIAAAEARRDDIARTCEEILIEEEEMAHWLELQIPKVVRRTLGSRRSAA